MCIGFAGVSDPSQASSSGQASPLNRPFAYLVRELVAAVKAGVIEAFARPQQGVGGQGQVRGGLEPCLMCANRFTSSA